MKGDTLYVWTQIPPGPKSPACPYCQIHMVGASYLVVLRSGDIHECLSGRMDDIQQFHDGCSIVGDGGHAVGIVKQLVHTTWAECRADSVNDGHAGIDVAYYLSLSLRCIRSLLEEDDLRLLLGARFNETARRAQQ